jgi:SAM-dependent methyltransferase
MATTGEIEATAFNAFEAEGWERRAGAYHGFFAPITSRAIDPLLDAAAVGPGTWLLDVATGPGYVVAAALARGAQPTGLDVAAEMVAMARRLNPGGALRARRRRAGAVRERRLRRGHRELRDPPRRPPRARRGRAGPGAAAAGSGRAQDVRAFAL